MIGPERQKHVQHIHRRLQHPQPPSVAPQVNRGEGEQQQELGLHQPAAERRRAAPPQPGRPRRHARPAEHGRHQEPHLRPPAPPHAHEHGRRRRPARTPLQPGKMKRRINSNGKFF